MSFQYAPIRFQYGTPLFPRIFELMDAQYPWPRDVDPRTAAGRAGQLSLGAFNDGLELVGAAIMYANHEHPNIPASAGWLSYLVVDEFLDEFDHVVVADQLLTDGEDLMRANDKQQLATDLYIRDEPTLIYGSGFYLPRGYELASTPSEHSHTQTFMKELAVAT